jgi:hypothetical protein
MYDCTDYAGNLYNCPTVAYSGEIDSQRQAAMMMESAMKKEGLTLVHILGPKTGHSYHPEAKKEVNRRIDRLAFYGRDVMPRRVSFTTWTLRYNQSFWVVLDGLDQHWEKASVNTELQNDRVEVSTKNVSALTLSMGPGECTLEVPSLPKVMLDGKELTAPPVLSDRSWTAHFRKKDGKWEVVDKVDDGTLCKRPGLQGPIDDAFMDSFLMVQPTGLPLNEKVHGWVRAEMEHARKAWRAQFRGEARIKTDDKVTDADIAQHNLILWGDPESNRILAKIADKLPIRWNAGGVRVGRRTFEASHHAPVLIYPNPLNPKRYVVLNSGFTFRDYDYLNNARQTPKLPDYAIIDLRTPPSSRAPGAITAAGFFDEQWQYKPEEK